MHPRLLRAREAPRTGQPQADQLQQRVTGGQLPARAGSRQGPPWRRQRPASTSQCLQRGQQAQRRGQGGGQSRPGAVRTLPQELGALLVPPCPTAPRGTETPGDVCLVLCFRDTCWASWCSWRCGDWKGFHSHLPVSLPLGLHGGQMIQPQTTTTCSPPAATPPPALSPSKASPPPGTQTSPSAYRVPSTLSPGEPLFWARLGPQEKAPHHPRSCRAWASWGKALPAPTTPSPTYHQTQTNSLQRPRKPPIR